jgi:hypothetical protein
MLGARLPGVELVVSQDPGVTRLAIAGFPAFHSTDGHVEEARLIDIPDSPLLLVLWGERDGQGVPRHIPPPSVCDLNER